MLLPARRQCHHSRRNTIWHYQQRLGVDGVTALFQTVDSQLLQHGCMARRGQIIVASTEPTVAIDIPMNNVSVPSPCCSMSG